ncbi:hypothetical protein SDRG_11626 [Saprolegnia diclina VS20]|uniref:Uncharacterized protein n=1 Tax=Saprolegnia diclina (strain VS20) TaxID=1156394 RepID=T0RE66_SAPDV|nr:hypothetical protein SDRG_11626 [Saprolegnia diclina VS20]EQC30568.1 hypothetical protein SDRG_11626 [Saprolegnia diclina VS20]|eukprot:XP_008615894.1 hypothetical protein SDRG_11626 [Saprolegnia diclina VS20]
MHSPSCVVSGCQAPALFGLNKCTMHKNRKICSVHDCCNIVYARQLCVRHGGKKQCSEPTCSAYARGGDYCGDHGGLSLKRFCIVEDCLRQAHANRKCVRHGGGRFCKAPGCPQHSRHGGFCHRHMVLETRVQAKRAQPVSYIKIEPMTSVPFLPEPQKYELDAIDSSILSLLDDESWVHSGPCSPDTVVAFDWHLHASS